MTCKFIQAAVIFSAGLSLIGLGAAGHAQPGLSAGSASPEPTTSAPASYRPVRFTGSANLWLAPRAEGDPFSPRGTIKLDEKSDPLMDPAAPAAYESTVVDATGGKFVDKGLIRFSKGEVQFAGVFPTENATTPVSGMLHTVAVQKVTGGTGVFEGAAGYILMNSTIGADGVHGTLDGLIYVRQ